MKRIVIAGVVGGVVLFMWGFVSWMFIPWHQLQQLPGESRIAEAMRDAEVPSGAYFMPNVNKEAMKTMTPEDKKAAQAASEEAHRQGPVALIMYQREGSSPMPIMASHQAAPARLVRAICLSHSIGTSDGCSWPGGDMQWVAIFAR